MVVGALCFLHPGNMQLLCGQQKNLKKKDPISSTLELVLEKVGVGEKADCAFNVSEQRCFLCI